MSHIPEASEANLLDKIFGGGVFRKKYKISYCESCEVTVLYCEKCSHSSCSGGIGTDPDCPCVTDPDWKSFEQGAYSFRDYLSAEEMEAVEKRNALKRILKKSLEMGRTEIDWKQMKKDGELSDADEERFDKQIKAYQKHKPQFRAE